MLLPNALGRLVWVGELKDA